MRSGKGAKRASGSHEKILSCAELLQFAALIAQPFLQKKKTPTGGLAGVLLVKRTCAERKQTGSAQEGVQPFSKEEV